jgi:lipopolysaccharide export LptBFGC system permease protein LptF
LRYRLEAKYAKFLPFTLDSLEEGPEDALPIARTALLLLALDRKDPKARWAPTWYGSGRNDAVDTRIILDVSFEDLSLASRARRGVEILPLNDLDASSKRLGPLGFVSEAFRAELLRRYSEPFSFLAVAIVALALGWRFRSLRGAGTLGIPMLLVLPVVLNLGVQVFRLVSSTTTAALVLALPFGAAIASALLFQGLLLIAALAFLAGQRG